MCVVMRSACLQDIFPHIQTTTTTLTAIRQSRLKHGLFSVMADKVCCVLRRPPALTTLRYDVSRTSADDARLLVANHLAADACCSYDVSVLPEPLSHMLAVRATSVACERVAAAPALAHVYVDSAAGRSVLRGAHLFAAGLLGSSRAFGRDEKVAVCMDLTGRCLRGRCEPMAADDCVCIALGVTAVGRHELFADNVTPTGVGVRVTERRFVCGAAPVNELLRTEAALRAGLRAQNVPSALAVNALLPAGRPAAVGGRTCVLDVCAAPGGKTAHIAALLGIQAQIVACESSANRARALLQVLQELAYCSVDVCHVDSTKLTKIGRCRPLNATDGSEVDFCERFSHVLLDAPCSNLGQRPLTFDVGKVKPKAYVPLQKRLFEEAVAVLSAGGRLVYSTCTLSVEENESVVAWALAKWPRQLRLVPLPFCLPAALRFHPAGSGLDERQSALVARFDPRPFCCRHDFAAGVDCLSAPCDDPTLYGGQSFGHHAGVDRLPLSDEWDTIGFFIACFEKSE